MTTFSPLGTSKNFVLPLVLTALIAVSLAGCSTLQKQTTTTGTGTTKSAVKKPAVKKSAAKKPVAKKTTKKVATKKVVAHGFCCVRKGLTCISSTQAQCKTNGEIFNLSKSACDTTCAS